MSIKNDHTLNPVIALGFYSNSAGTQLVLAGEGCFLKAFEAESSKLICQIKVFEAQAVHGILVRDGEGQGNALQVAIWGGSLLTLLRKEVFEALLCQNLSSIDHLASSVSDWVLDVAISPYDDSCVLVTAHNTVLRARLQSDGQLLRLETLSSPSRSILYSAHLIWESSACVLVAAGTVFGEIIAWQCYISDDALAAGCQVLATLTGHEGSIFGVNISPLIFGVYKTPIRLLASCSDDRTIRIWNIYGSWTEGSPAEVLDIADSVLLRETGFGDNGQRGHSPRITNKCLAMIMGHASRIWRVKFQISNLDSSELSSVRVFSFGEDSTVQQWVLDLQAGSQPLTAIPALKDTADLGNACRLSHLNTFAFHSGKHIWSTALHQLNITTTLLVTGGADGKVSSYEIPLSLSADMVSLLATALDEPGINVLGDNGNTGFLPRLAPLELKDVLDSITPGLGVNIPTINASPIQSTSKYTSTIIAAGERPKKSKPQRTAKDTFNRYTFVSDDCMLATTNYGRVLLGQISSSVKWEELLLPESGKEDLKSYSIIKGIPELGVAFLAGANGSIYIYQVKSTITKVAQVVGKVADIFPLFNLESGRIDLVVATLTGKDAMLFTFDHYASSPFIVNNVPYHLPERFVVTGVGKSNDILVFGARNGSLATYDITNNSGALGTWKPDKAENTGDAITSIISLPSPIFDQHYFVTTGRNGVYSIFVVTVTRQENFVTESVIRQIHRGTPPLGPNIEAAWFEGPDLLLYGFKSKNFIVWNETKQYEVMNIECGGAHRSYAYSPIQHSKGGYFIYTKASKLYLHSWKNPSHRIIKHGGHGREIKACAISPDHNFIATGAEDTAIRIWRYREGASVLHNHFDCLAVIQGHTAGIQHLQWYGSKYLFSSAGNEEFFVWAIEFIPGFGMGIVREASDPDPSEDRDLRIMSFDVREAEHLFGAHYESPPLLISMAYSDSTLRTYRYSRSSAFELIATARYTSSCLMQIRHIETAEGEIYLLTAATDGNLVVWKTPASTSRSCLQNQPTQQLIRISTCKLHQNSIKSLDTTISRATKSIIVATGGDDNAIGISIYNFENLNSEPRSIILRSAHVAAITGLCFVYGGQVSEANMGEELRITSSSNDQRVKEWALAIDREGRVGIKMMGDAFTSVADVGDIAALGDGRGDGDVKVLIVGNGMEVFRISSE